MTTIIWDGTYFAADRMSINGSQKEEVRKLHRLDGGLFGAFAGSYGPGLMLIDWFQNGADLSAYPAPQKTDEWTRLIVCARSGQPSVYENHPVALTFLGPFHAWGSGSQYALGALAAGATVGFAMEIACRFDPSSGIAYDIVDLQTGEMKEVRL
jgi:20S proteasome alpha/beta subunit